MLEPKFLTCMAIVVTLPIMVVACGTELTPPETPPETTSGEENTTAASDTGTLNIVANGEDFVRQGFVTKDGWQIDFEHLYVTLDEVTAYQSDPPFDAEAGGNPEATETVTIDEPVTIDLAEGDADAEPILVKAVEAPMGRYNALSWKIIPAEDGPAAGQTLWMEGTATKDNATINFALKLDPTLRYVCGDFVGDSRKGILENTDTAEMEATFHFDHLFGDGEAAPDDDINTGALGFEPLAAIAQDGTLDVTMADLEAQLSPEEYNTLMGILPSLGHVGEGHCNETELNN
ncbi:hypothetical protein Lepto7376_0551 [[Leptolyngbya] sp. PCC 7376]|uniref:hypothetical protein n=1 Tax=[Leptolyngbya] sp. PCC 7376 TaxID=111781 RepID=UPI00029F44C6|nr:hypothetical protein [[Leptolyngbya] sp. PCC 7376]AFY36977.1 hypothetical protein Lepto7376_0551 [[Leptolyngbya] sp. PCC 7376]